MTAQNQLSGEERGPRSTGPTSPASSQHSEPGAAARGSVGFTERETAGVDAVRVTAPVQQSKP